ncbi:hypothetical protein [Kiloniella sp.]|uniref:hypothetical protein n=1 Tax=Kiloniella sp. TaxID=1938587 RepID=UPI003B02A82B
MEPLIKLLKDRGYNPSIEQPEIQPVSDGKGRYCILIEADIDPHWMTPFAKWLIKKTKLEALQIELEDSTGKIIAGCNLYGAGSSSF